MSNPLSDILSKMNDAKPAPKDVLEAEVGKYTQSVSDAVDNTYPKDAQTQQVPFKDLK